MDALFELLMWITPIVAALAVMAWLADWLEEIERERMRYEDDAQRHQERD